MRSRATVPAMKTLVFCLAIIIGAATSTFAQPGDPGGGGDPDVPISGIEILIALGSLLGIGRFFTRSKAKHN
jgi:hypothetical protein